MSDDPWARVKAAHVYIFLGSCGHLYAFNMVVPVVMVHSVQAMQEKMPV
jgi:hypothetical protein